MLPNPKKPENTIGTASNQSIDARVLMRIDIACVEVRTYLSSGLCKSKLCQQHNISDSSKESSAGNLLRPVGDKRTYRL